MSNCLFGCLSVCLTVRLRLRDKLDLLEPFSGDVRPKLFVGAEGVYQGVSLTKTLITYQYCQLIAIKSRPHWRQIHTLLLLYFTIVVSAPFSCKAISSTVCRQTSTKKATEGAIAVHLAPKTTILVVNILQGSAVTRTVLDWLIVYSPVANCPFFTRAINYDSWLAVDNVIANAMNQSPYQINKSP